MRVGVLAVLTAAALAGCTLAPTYKRPSAPIPTAWPQGESYAPPVAGPSAQAVAWTAFFGDPKLQAILAQALAENRDLRAAVAEIEAARAGFRARRADLLPTVAASASGVEERVPGWRTATGQAETQRAYSAALGFSAFEIDLFGRLRSLSRSAFEQYLATEAGRRAVQASLIAETATNYYALAADLDLLIIAKQTYAAQKGSLDLIRARFEHGAASMIEVRQAETTVEQARSDIARFTTQAAQDRNALELAAGGPVAEALLPTGLPAAPQVMVDLPAGLSSDVLLSRPDVLQAEHQLKASNAEIGAARAAFFPRIALTAVAGLASGGLSNLFSGGAFTWTVAPSATLPIFDWGTNSGNLAYAKAQREGLLAAYQKSIQTAFREVSDALARRGTIDAEVQADQLNLTAAQDTLTLGTARYRQGIDPYLSTLVAQRDLYSARQRMANIRLTKAQNLVALYQALGGDQTVEAMPPVSGQTARTRP